MSVEMYKCIAVGIVAWDLYYTLIYTTTASYAITYRFCCPSSGVRQTLMVCHTSVHASLSYDSNVRPLSIHARLTSVVLSLELQCIDQGVWNIWIMNVRSLCCAPGWRVEHLMRYTRKADLQPDLSRSGPARLNTAAGLAMDVHLVC
jgi:hypothetical protein